MTPPPPKNKSEFNCTSLLTTKLRAMKVDDASDIDMKMIYEADPEGKD
jgi:hypothetical protein